MLSYTDCINVIYLLIDLSINLLLLVIFFIYISVVKVEKKLWKALDMCSTNDTEENTLIRTKLFATDFSA